MISALEGDAVSGAHQCIFSSSLYRDLMKAVTKEAGVTDESLIALFLNVLEIVPTYDRRTECTFQYSRYPHTQTMEAWCVFFLLFLSFF